MKKISKLLAGLTAICCMAGMCSLFPAQAETSEGFFVVCGTFGSSVMLDYYYGNMYHELIRWSSEESFDYGDILRADGEFLILETFPAQLALSDGAKLEKTGDISCFDSREVTVTGGGAMHVYTWDNPYHEDIGQFQLRDENAHTYSYSQYYNHVIYGVDMENAQTGDVYEFKFYNDTPILPVRQIEIANPMDFVVVGTSDTGYIISSGFYCYYLDNTYLKAERLEAGDTIEFRNIDITPEPWMKTCHLFPTAGADASIVKTGSILKNQNLKHFTVKENESDSDYLYLTDENGKEYPLHKDWLNGTYSSPYYSDFSTLEAGDMVVCYVYKEQPVIPVETLTSEITPEPLTGDATGNGELDITDVILVNRAIFGKQKLSDEALAQVDFNQNGMPDAEDSLTMMKKIVKLL